VTQKIRKTGNLRAFLSDAMVKVVSGEMKPEQAQTVAKLAAQVNENLYAEIKTQRLHMELKREVGTFGEMVIGDDDGNEKVQGASA
jgi:hypothetical protein